MNKKHSTTNYGEEEIDLFEKTLAQLESVHNEISILSRKMQNDAVNSFKLKLINKLLADANHVLGEGSRPFSDFVSFQDDSLPTNSDVSMILSQYLTCMEKQRSDSISYEYGDWYWRESKRKTYPPLKLVRN